MGSAGSEERVKLEKLDWRLFEWYKQSERVSFKNGIISQLCQQLVSPLRTFCLVSALKNFLLLYLLFQCHCSLIPCKWILEVLDLSFMLKIFFLYFLFFSSSLWNLGKKGFGFPLLIQSLFILLVLKNQLSNFKFPRTLK